MTSNSPRINDVADRLFAAIEHGDGAALAAMWADDVVVWRLGGGGERDKPRALKVIDWFITVTSERTYEVLDRRIFDGGFVQQHNVHARTRTGVPVTFRACLVVKAGADGLIRRIDEYLDPAEVAALAQES